MFIGQRPLISGSDSRCGWIVVAYWEGQADVHSVLCRNTFYIHIWRGTVPDCGWDKTHVYVTWGARLLPGQLYVCFYGLLSFFHPLTHSFCPSIRPHPLRHPSFYSLSPVNLKPYSRSSSTFCPASILNSKINYVVVVTIPFKLRNQLRRGLMGTKKFQCLDKGCNNCWFLIS